MTSMTPNRCFINEKLINGSNISILGNPTIINEPIKTDTSSANKVDAIQKQATPFITSAAEKKLVRKINLALMPFVGVIMSVQTIDRRALPISAALGLIEDTHLTITQYGWLGSIFYLGFICYQLPNSYFIQKIPVGKYLGSLLVLAGVVLGTTALCNTFTQLAVLRALLGVFEAGINPCLMIIINTVYRRREQSAAFGLMYASIGAGIMVGSAFSYGISFINNANGIHSWRWPYIIWGSVTCFLGVITFFFMPDHPRSFMFRLTANEKQIVEERTKDNAVVRVYEIKRHHIWEALREPRLWLICFSTMLSYMQTGGIVVFSTLIVKNLGFSGPDAILLQIPSGAISSCFCVMAVVIARKSGQLYFAASVSAGIALIGVILLAVLPNTGVKLAGYLLSATASAEQVILVTIVGSNVVGYTKKIFYNMINMIFYTLGNFIGPLVILEKEAPYYKTGMIIYCIGNAVTLVMLFVVRQIMARQNKVKLHCNSGLKEVDVEKDLTDRENTTFLYRL